MPKPVTIFDYTGNGPIGAPIPLSAIPAETPFVWAETVGGGPSPTPVMFGDLSPNGTPAHGGMLANINSSLKVINHRY